MRKAAELKRELGRLPTDNELRKKAVEILGGLRDIT
jgi:hypothetical protein